MALLGHAMNTSKVLLPSCDINLNLWDVTLGMAMSENKLVDTYQTYACCWSLEPLSREEN